MQKKLIYLSLLISLLSLVFSCQTDSFELEQDSDSVIELTDGRLRVPIQLYISEREVVETKSAPSDAETTIRNAYVLVFEQDGNNLLLQRVEATQNSTDRTKIYADLRPYLSSCFIHVLINLSTENIEIIKSATKLDDIRHLTEKQSSLDNDILPLSSARIGLSAINTNTVKDLTIPLKFAYARVDVSVKEEIKDQFSLQEGFVINAAKEGYVIEHAGLAPDFGGECSSKIISANDPQRINELYIFENNGASDNQQQGTNPTDLLIKGTKTGFSEGYYKIRIAYGTNKDSYDIRRGVRYAVNITSVKGPGYLTKEEAEENEPSNVEFEIKVNDGSSKDVVVSNGKYYLGVSNTEFIVCADNAHGVTATTLSHNAPSSVSTASIQVQGTGITLSANQQGLTVSQDGKSATINLQTPKVPIKVDLTSTAQPGTLTIRIGDLVKTIAIKKIAKVEDAGGTKSLSDLGLANSSIVTMNSLSPRITVGQDKSLVVSKAENSKYDAYSYAEAFSTGQQGTIRIAVKQTIENVVYYEQYADNSYGFYFRDNTSTLSDTKTIKDTGYGILGTRSDITKIQLDNHLNGQVFNPGIRVISGLSDCSLILYSMSHKNINPIGDTNAVGVFVNNAQTTANYIYPNFAKVISTSSAINTGTAGYPPFSIRTPKQFRNINAIASLDGGARYYSQERDLNFADTNIGGAASFATAIITNEFKGNYDGTGKAIRNLTLNNTNESMALFRTNSGTLRDMRLYNINVTGKDKTSCLVGTNNGTIETILIDGLRIIASGRFVGAIAGENMANGFINNCLVMANAETDSPIYSSYNNSTSSPNVGGITGINRKASRGIKNVCVLDKCQTPSKPFVNGIDANNATAGIVAYNEASIENAVYLAMPPYGYVYGNSCQFPICRYMGLPTHNTSNTHYLRILTRTLRGENTGIARQTENNYIVGNYEYISFNNASIVFLKLDPTYWEKVSGYPYPKLKSFPVPESWPVKN